jgi:hypothetical protein
MYATTAPPFEYSFPSPKKLVVHKNSSNFAIFYTAGVLTPLCFFLELGSISLHSYPSKYFKRLIKLGRLNNEPKSQLSDKAQEARYAFAKITYNC